MRWLRRIKIYKNLLLAILVLNAFLIVTGITFVVRHYQGQRAAEKAYQKQVQSLKVLDQVSLKLDELEKNSTWTGQEWLKLGELQAYTNASLPETQLDFGAALKNQTPELAPLKQKIVEEKALALQSLVESGQDLGEYRREIVIIAILSIFLGFVLPSVILYLLKNQAVKFHTQIESRVVGTLTTLHSEWLKHQNQGTKQTSLFWLDVGLLTLAQVTKEIDHPAAAYAYQLSQKLYQELQVGPKNDIENGDQVP